MYARGPSDITRGKIHGSVDIGLSVISTKTKSRRIDIDAEEFIYHLKVNKSILIHKRLLILIMLLGQRV